MPYQSEQLAQKEPYEPMIVEDLGSLEDLTQGGAGPLLDLTLAGSQ